MSLPFKELKALVFLNRLIVGGGRHIRSLLSEGGLPSEIHDRIHSENYLDKAESLKTLQKTFDPEREIELADQKGIRFLTPFDPDYPALLQKIPDPPALLYMRGSVLASDEAAIAVVGSRHPSLYGMTQAKRLSRDLAQAGLTIVSGLARGIDQAAHEAALEISYGRSLAVLGCGVDRVYPRESQKLYERLIERGAIFSEYALGTPPFSENFPRRNRIISGLSQGVLVVEAHSRSGSLITAREAAEQGRDVFSVPGPIDQLTSRGTNQLIKDGAMLADNAQDMLQALALPLRGLLPASVMSSEAGKLEGKKSENKSDTTIAPYDSDLDCNEEEQELIDALRPGPLSYDEIMAKKYLKPGRLSVMLTELEIMKKIRKNQDGRFMLVAA